MSTTKRKKVSLNFTFELLFKKKRNAICSKMRSGDDLLNALEDAELITSVQKAEIAAEVILYKRNSKLLDEVKHADDSKVPEFFEALVLTGQRAVVNILVGYRTSDDEFVPTARSTLDESDSVTSSTSTSSALPLKRKIPVKGSSVNTTQMSKKSEPPSFSEAFEGKRGSLKKMLNLSCGELVTSLQDKGVLTEGQVANIKHKMNTEHEAMDLLLDMLSKRPKEDVPKFCESLCESKQCHVVRECLNNCADFCSCVG